MRKGPGGKKEIRLHKIHCGVQYAWILGECGLVVARDETGGLNFLEAPQQNWVNCRGWEYVFEGSLMHGSDENDGTIFLLPVKEDTHL